MNAEDRRCTPGAYFSSSCGKERAGIRVHKNYTSTGKHPVDTYKWDLDADILVRYSTNWRAGDAATPCSMVSAPQTRTNDVTQTAMIGNAESRYIRLRTLRNSHSSRVNNLPERSAPASMSIASRAATTSSIVGRFSGLKAQHRSIRARKGGGQRSPTKTRATSNEEQLVKPVKHVFALCRMSRGKSFKKE